MPNNGVVEGAKNVMSTMGNSSKEQKAPLLLKDSLESRNDDGEIIVADKSCRDYCYDFLPAPPHPNRFGSDTCYDQWINGCDCVSESEVNQMLVSNLRSTRYAGEMCRICMFPVYCLDRITYKICCCGDYQNCNCRSNPCAERLFCYLSVTKLPCILLSAVGGGIGWVVGSVQNLVCGPDSTNQIDVEEAKEIKEEKRQPEPLLDPTDRGQKFQKNMEVCIKNHDLFSIVKYLQKNHLDINQLCGAISISFGLPLLCLAINHAKNDVSLKERKWLMDLLLHNGVSINGASLPQYNGWTQFLIPLYEALTSSYLDSPELLAFLCERGANVYQPVVMKDNNRWIEVPIFNWACIRYFSYRFEEERQNFINKVEILQNAAKKSTDDLSNYIAARRLLIPIIGIDEVVNLIGGYSHRFFKPVLKHVRPEIQQADRREKNDESVDPFGVLTEFKVEDALGFRAIPTEYSLVLPIRPKLPKGEPAGP